MKVSYNWLQEWIDVQLSVEALAERLTFSGLEVDEIIAYPPRFENIVVAHINAVEPHPNADKLSLCQVDAGDGQNRQIVCGADNVYSGMKAPLALPGAKLGELKIKKSKLRGYTSEGMLCSPEELGFTLQTKGIMDLGSQARIGQNLDDHLHIADSVIDIDLTPNRADCMSVLGVARETAALIQKPAPELPHTTITAVTEYEINVHLQAGESCPRYCARYIHNIDMGAPTPPWMQYRLQQCGMNPHNPIVDLTNYILLELGQPLHAFDADKLEGEITVRYARQGETITLLDGRHIELTPAMLVIADDVKPVALAGVMGGYDTAVDTSTRNVLLESAHFKPSAIALTSQDNQIYTDSSSRFERGVDWTLPRPAIERATALMIETAGGEPGPVTCKENDYIPQEPVINLEYDRIRKILGITVPHAQVVDYLRRLSMTVNDTGSQLQVEAPSYRFDILRPVDLIEEVARLHGYEEVNGQLPQIDASAQSRTSDCLALNDVRMMCMAMGYDEVVNYSFIEPELQRRLYPQVSPLTLANPISNEMSELRAGLWPSLIKTIQYNQARQQGYLKLFELGACFQGEETHRQETDYLAFAWVKRLLPQQWGISGREPDFYDLKGDLEQVLDLSGHNYTFRRTNHPALHPGRSAEIVRHNKVIGYAGELHPQLVADYELQGPVLLAEFVWHDLITACLPSVSALSPYPEVKRDIALILDQTVEYGALEASIWKIAPQVLKDIQIFDIYQGQNIAEGKKSFAIRLYYQHAARTLVDDEVNEITQTIIDHLHHEFAATLRGPANGNNES